MSGKDCAKMWEGPRKYYPFLLIAACMFFAVNAAWAAGYNAKTLAQINKLRQIDALYGDMPASLGPGITVVSADEVKALMAKGVEVIDTRGKSPYERKRIEGAKWLFCDDLLENPALAGGLDKSRPYVLYCSGIKCWRSPAVALMLRDLGFKKLYWYRLGFSDWEAKKYPTQ